VRHLDEPADGEDVTDGRDSVTNQNAVPHAAQRRSSLIIPPPARARPTGAIRSLAQDGQRRSRVSGKRSTDGIVWMGWVMMGLAAILGVERQMHHGLGARAPTRTAEVQARKVSGGPPWVA
jgi:hypothetical protein